MTEFLKCAVIGVGYFGRLHAEKYTNIESCQLSAVVDTDSAIASQIAARYSTTPLTDYRELLGKVDAVSIATQVSTHHSIARDFLSHGTHVLIEKPITKNLSEADELIKLAEHNQCILQVGHIERFNPILDLLKDEDLDGSFIQTLRLTPFVNRNHDVSVILDLMVHDLDLAIFLVNSDIKYISAKGLPVLSAEIDIANTRIEFQNHCIVDLSASRISREKSRKWHIFTKDKGFSIHLGENRGLIYQKDPIANKIKTTKKVFPKTDMLLNEIKHFVDCILHQRTPVVDGHVGRKILETALEITNKIK